jgi:hypothetical protein
MPFRGFAAGQKARRSFGKTSGIFVEYYLLLSVRRTVKNSTVWTSLKKSSKEQGRIEVKLLTLKYLYTCF